MKSRAGIPAVLVLTSACALAACPSQAGDEGALAKRILQATGVKGGLVVRYERKLQIYSAFFHLACLIIVLKRL